MELPEPREQTEPDYNGSVEFSQHGMGTVTAGPAETYRARPLNVPERLSAEEVARRSDEGWRQARSRPLKDESELQYNIRVGDALQASLDSYWKRNRGTNGYATQSAKGRRARDGQIMEHLVSFPSPDDAGNATAEGEDGLSYEHRATVGGQRNLARARGGQAVAANQNRRSAGRVVGGPDERTACSVLEGSGMVTTEGLSARADWQQDPGLRRVREQLARKAAQQNGDAAEPAPIGIDGIPENPSVATRGSLAFNEHRGSLHDGPGWLERQIASQPVLAEQHAAAEARRLRIYAESAARRQPPAPRPPVGDARPALRDAIRERDAAQSAFDAAQQAVAESDDMLREANGLLAELDGAEQSHAEGLSQQLKHWFVSGRTGPRPTVAPPAALSAARSVRAAAEADVAAIEQARGELVDAFEQARGTLESATALVHSCAAAVLAGELAGRALLAQARLDEFLESANEIAVASRLHFPTGVSGSAPVPIACGDDARSVLLAFNELSKPDLAPPVRAGRDATVTDEWRSLFTRLLVDGAAEPADEHPDLN
jgi:hypothetical protein